MTGRELSRLIGALAQYYWSIPVDLVTKMICEWHPEVKMDRIKRHLNKMANGESEYRYVCRIVTEGLPKPELVASHLIDSGRTDLKKFLAARIDAPFADCDEQTVLAMEHMDYNIPEADAIIAFAKKELQLDDEFATQLVFDCYFSQSYSLFNGKSWVMSVLDVETFGPVEFHTVKQLQQYRELGNKLYQVLPNPVLRGWKPMEIENPPVVPDAIPERDEDIPYVDRDKLRAVVSLMFADLSPKKGNKSAPMENIGRTKSVPMENVGRNKPCPCGSGKKYKMCCGRVKKKR